MTQKVTHNEPETVETQHTNYALRKTLPDNGIPRELTYYAIGIGLLLVVAGIGLIIAGKPSVSSNLMTCVGFGLLLVSFGSRASGSWGSWSATGAGAMAVLLFLLLQHYSPPLSPIDFSRKGKFVVIFPRLLT
jgi:hypothetical protein